MDRVEEERARSAAARLTDVADANLYRRNPFRITGLPTAVIGRAVREARQRQLSRYGAVPAGARLPLPEPPTREAVRAAFDELADAERRLVAELLWLWDEPAGCGCAPAVHALHDAAVLEHAAALDRDPGAPPDLASWRKAAAAWCLAVRDQGLWAHLHHRRAALGDRG